MRELAEHCDVHRELQGRRHGALRPDYASLKAINPRLVYCSLTGFGQTAVPRARATTYIIQGMGGLMSVTGERDDEMAARKRWAAGGRILFTGMYATGGHSGLRCATPSARVKASI